MKLFIAGGSGFVGRYLVPLASGRFETSYSYFSQNPHALPNGYQLDLRDGDAVSTCVSAIQPDAIIHLGASNRSPDMYNTIVEGTRNLVAAAQQVGARLVHMSTDVLFDGSAPPYQEPAEPNPIHTYGAAKAAAETIAATYTNQVTVRTSLIYHEDNQSSIRWMQALIDRGETFALYDNQWRNPVQVVDLSEACLELAQHAFTGVLHVAGPQAVTRAYFGRKQLAYFGISAENAINGPDTTGKFPLDVRLDTRLAQSILTTKLRSVDEVFG